MRDKHIQDTSFSPNEKFVLTGNKQITKSQRMKKRLSGVWGCSIEGSTRPGYHIKCKWTVYVDSKKKINKKHEEKMRKGFIRAWRCSLGNSLWPDHFIKKCWPKNCYWIFIIQSVYKKHRWKWLCKNNFKNSCWSHLRPKHCYKNFKIQLFINKRLWKWSRFKN